MQRSYVRSTLTLRKLFLDRYCSYNIIDIVNMQVYTYFMWTTFVICAYIYACIPLLHYIVILPCKAACVLKHAHNVMQRQESIDLPDKFIKDDFLRHQPSNLLCVKCDSVPYNPLRSICCSKLYCEPCSKKSKKCHVRRRRSGRGGHGRPTFSPDNAMNIIIDCYCLK